VKTKALAENSFDDYWLKQRFTPANGRENGDETVTFAPAQLKKLFSAPLYTGCEDDGDNFAKPGKRVIRRGRFWVPLIALFHGLRLNEICQLYTQDVRALEGELVLEVRPSLDGGEAHDKRLKNKASTRTVPIHPDLLKMGFAEFVEQRRQDAKSPRLFPELRSAPKSGSYGDIFSKWFTRFLVSTLGEKPRATFHSFRHGWRDALREADVSEERVNKLGGWAHHGQHAKYGRAKLIQLLKVEIGKVRFEGLDLSHLYQP
jgi:integrase